MQFFKLTPFGYEVGFLNDTIVTATHKTFNLRNKNLIKFLLRITGLPHYGARHRAFHLNRLLNSVGHNAKVLDAGCGIGLNSFLAARKELKVLGVDNDRKKITLANKMLSKTNHSSVRFLVSDVTNLKLKKESFDYVICFEVLEHIQKDDKAINQISKVLKKNGILILSTPGLGIISSIHQDSKHHVREGYSLKEIQKKLNENDLRIKEVVCLEHTLVGFLVRLTNDWIRIKSLALSVLLFPLFFFLGIVDGYFPKMITPNNWIIVAKKTK